MTVSRIQWTRLDRKRKANLCKAFGYSSGLEDNSLIEPYTCIIADDHAIVRAGLRTAFEAEGLIAARGFRIVAEAENGVEAISMVRQFRPDLLLLDVQMPHAGGSEVAVEIRRWSPDTKIIVLTGISALGKLSELIDFGVDGLFSKATSNDELYAAVPKILTGGRHISSHIVEQLESAPNITPLTERERQTLNLVAMGQSNKEIAETLGISVKTVDRHRTNMMQKLDVHSVAQLIAFALKEGLIDPSSEL